MARRQRPPSERVEAVTDKVMAGTPVRQIANEYGVSERTIYRWMESSAARTQMEEARNRLVERTSRLLSTAAPTAILTLVQIMMDDRNRPEARVAAANSVLKSLGYGTTSKVELSGPDGGPIQIGEAVKLVDDQLTQVMGRLGSIEVIDVPEGVPGDIRGELEAG